MTFRGRPAGGSSPYVDMAAAMGRRGAGAIGAGIEPPALCAHHFSAAGCRRGERCRFSHHDAGASLPAARPTSRSSSALAPRTRSRSPALAYAGPSLEGAAAGPGLRTPTPVLLGTAPSLISITAMALRLPTEQLQDLIVVLTEEQARRAAGR